MAPFDGGRHENLQRRTLAVIGAGPSGLATCAAALEEGLRPTVFEQADGVGGLWRSDKFGKVWNSLKTNLSKYTCAFSDAPWPARAPDFPTSSEVQAYLQKYADDRRLHSYIRTRCCVMAVEPVPQHAAGTGSRWRITWAEGADESSREQRSEVFDFVVVATGIFAKPSMGLARGADSFGGKIMHAADYREPSSFCQKRVLVVGAAFSGADIAVEVARSGATVVVASRRPIWYLPRYIGGKPADLAFYSRVSRDRGLKATEEERNSKRHAFFRSLVGDLPPSLVAPEPERGDLPFVAITDSFLDAVRAGEVQVLATELVGFDGTKACFENGHTQEFDIVMFATGYRLELPFLPKDLKEAIDLDADDQLIPMLLHKAVWPLPDRMPQLAFVGMYRGPYFAAMELQARWACGVFSGRLPTPTLEDCLEGQKEARAIREQRPRPQFPHGDYTGMADELAMYVGVRPAKMLEDNAHPMQKALYEGPLLPFHYRLDGFGAKQRLARGAIQECLGRYPFAPQAPRGSCWDKASSWAGRFLAVFGCTCLAS